MSKRERLSKQVRKRETVLRPGECLFCGKTGELTEQHVFGKWLRNLGLKGRSIWEVSQGAGDSQRRTLPPGSLFSKRLRIVCEPCNTGWMSRLESAAKPYLMDMFSGRGNIPLDEDAQLVLARWAFMTICVVSQVGDSATFPLAHCHELYSSDRPPEHSQIWIGSASVNVSKGWDQVAEFRHERNFIDSALGEGTIPFPVYTSQLRLLNVVFEVQGSWPNEFGLGLERVDSSANLRRALLPIWPSKFPTIWWPPVTSLDTVGGVRGLATTQLVGPDSPPLRDRNAP